MLTGWSASLETPDGGPNLQLFCRPFRVSVKAAGNHDIARGWTDVAAILEVFDGSSWTNQDFARAKNRFKSVCFQRSPLTGIGRVEVWRGDVRLSMSVSAPFVWRCLSGSAVAPFHTPLIEPDVRTARIRLSDKTSRRLSSATPSAASAFLNTTS